MTKPKKKKKAEELEALTSDEVVRYVFGAKGQQVLKEQLVRNEPPDEDNDPQTPE